MTLVSSDRGERGDRWKDIYIYGVEILMVY